jgi:hypothetical protein
LSLLETRKTAEADKFAVQVDGLMRAANCRFSQDSLNSLLLIHSNHNDAAGAHDAYARLRDHGLEVEADSLAAYMRLLAFTVPETALAVGYRSRRDGITINGQMYTSMIRACLDLNQLQRAVALFDMGIRQGVRHTSVTFGWLLDAFCQLRDDARVDEFFAWSKAQNAPMNDGAHDVIIRRALNRNDVDAAQQLIEAAIDAGFVVDGARFLELVMRLLAIDQRRRAQQFLRAVAPKISPATGAVQAVKAVASAFGREWNDAVDWLHEMRDLGVHVPRSCLRSPPRRSRTTSRARRAFVALMREQKVPVVRDHYGVALRNCAHDATPLWRCFARCSRSTALCPTRRRSPRW